MTATFNKFDQFVENLGKGVHNFTADANCTVTVALCAAANAPVASNMVLADLTEVAYTNLSSRVVTGITFEQVLRHGAHDRNGSSAYGLPGPWRRSDTWCCMTTTQPPRLIP